MNVDLTRPVPSDGHGFRLSSDDSVAVSYRPSLHDSGGVALGGRSTTVIINRWISRQDGMFGAMAIWDQQLGWIPYCATLEQPWMGNAPGQSCIPAGTYICRPWKGVKFPDTYEVTNVPGRLAILFHWGNTVRDTEGCIVLGSSYSILDGYPAVTTSRAVFAAWMEFMGHRP